MERQRRSILAGPLSVLVAASLLLPSADPAWAAESTVPPLVDPSTLEPQQLQAMFDRLDPQDPAVRYILTLRKESTLWLAGGAAVVGLTVLLGLIEITTPQDGVGGGPFIVATGMPLGIGAFVAGVPSLVLGTRYREWYAVHGPAPTRLARLKLTHRWEMEEVRYRRDTAFIAAGVLGVCAALSGVVWAVRDRRDESGGGSQAHGGADAYGTVVFSSAAAAAAVLGIVFQKDLKDRLTHEHRVYGAAVGTGPMPGLSIGPTTGVGDGTPGLQIRASLSGTF